MDLPLSNRYWFELTDELKEYVCKKYAQTFKVSPAVIKEFFDSDHVMVFEKVNKMWMISENDLIQLVAYLEIIKYSDEKNSANIPPGKSGGNPS